METNTLHLFVTECASIASNIVELIALILIIYAVLKTLINYVVKYQMDFHKMHSDDSLIRGLSIALEVLLAGEILKTITASNRDTLVEIFLIILMRVFMTIVIRWEESSKDDASKSKNIVTSLKDSVVPKKTKKKTK